MFNSQSHKKYLICILFACILSVKALCNQLFADTTPLSTQQQALAFLAAQGKLKPSPFWPKIKPDRFLENLKKNIEHPLSLYEGRSTNFCAYAALSYLPLHDDPLGFVTFMVHLYNNGNAIYGKEYFKPSKPLQLVAGGLSFKGELDIRPADQLWFLLLADHFKGYLNLLDKHFDVGDENKKWAAVNYSKFNRMIRRLFNYNVIAVGSDLVPPHGVNNVYNYLSERLQSGNVALFVNNILLYKKKHTRLKLAVPTHFIILLDIKKVGDNIAFTYWDYGGKSLQELSPYFLRKIIFGISHITKKTANAQ